MTLSERDIRKILDWLQQKGRGRAFACPWCASNNWAPSNELAFPVTIDSQTTRVNYLEGIPMVAVVCNECSYIMLFNAAKIGVINT